MDERARRVGENEAIYRSVNERIKGLNETFGFGSGPMTIVCECGDLTCAERFEVPMAEYERIRADPTLFFALQGHDIPDVEDVVERAQGYTVVCKHRGDPAQVARATDPRR